MKRLRATYRKLQSADACAAAVNIATSPKVLLPASLSRSPYTLNLSAFVRLDH